MRTRSRSFGSFGSLPRLSFGLATGKVFVVEERFARERGHGPRPKRIAMSTSSVVKLASAVEATTFTSISGCASMKRMRRGMSQREAKDGSTLTVRRWSRRSPSASAASKISCSAARTRSANARPAGERHALAVAMEERRAEVLFERAHLVAHGAVGEVQLVGRAREALQARRRLEGAQRRQGGQAFRHM